MRKTPLDEWSAGITGGDLRAFQLEKLNQTLRICRNSSYYRGALPEKVNSLSELAALPFMDAGILAEYGSGLVCVPQREITRIVSLFTSGTTGPSKRVYFTQADQELTIDHFANGMKTIADPGWRMAVLLPCESPGGVGELICRALRRILVDPLPHGIVGDLAECARLLEISGAQSLVGIPVQVLALARYCRANSIKPAIERVLLSTDSIPSVLKDELKRLWGCDVYEHYGMTEMGLGAAVDCDAHSGCHIRENDLIFEIADDNGNQLPDGEYGEVVFTTLTRQGMPFIRYRTGDISAILPGVCPCGSSLRRLAPILGRKNGDAVMACGTVLRHRDFDDVLFRMPEVCDFSLEADPRDNSLKIEVETQRSTGDVSAEEVGSALSDAGLTKGISVSINIIRRPDRLTMRAGGKRLIKIAAC